MLVRDAGQGAHRILILDRCRVDSVFDIGQGLFYSAHGGPVQRETGPCGVFQLWRVWVRR